MKIRNRQKETEVKKRDTNEEFTEPDKILKTMERNFTFK
jgi:hypothetical protein